MNQVNTLLSRHCASFTFRHWLSCQMGMQSCKGLKRDGPMQARRWYKEHNKSNRGDGIHKIPRERHTHTTNEQIAQLILLTHTINAEWLHRNDGAPYALRLSLAIFRQQSVLEHYTRMRCRRLADFGSFCCCCFFLCSFGGAVRAAVNIDKRIN